MDDGRTPDQRRCGKTCTRPVVEFGESVHSRPVGENSALRGGDQRLLRGVYEEIWCRDLSHARWCEERNENCENDGTREMGSRVQCNVCWSSFAVETGSTGRRYVTKRDLVKYGYTDECQACTQLASGMHNAKVPHDNRCRDRIGELMAEDDDQRQVEREFGAAEVEIARLEAGEEVDVGEPTVVEDQQSDPQSVTQPVSQPVPTVRVRGSSGSGTRSEQVQERVKQTQMIVK